MDVEYAGVGRAVAAVATGGMVVVVDAADREIEGRLVMAAESCSTEDMAFFIRYTSGLVCVSVSVSRADELHLPLMVPTNTESQGTAFNVTVDYGPGTSIGISAADRAQTTRALANPDLEPAHLNRPGHVLVLRAKEGGVLRRPGHPEAAFDLARLAGRYPAGVLCELVTADGSEMARGPELVRFATEHGLPLVTIPDLVSYQRRHTPLVQRVSEANLPTRWGRFTAHAYRDLFGDEHVALTCGENVAAPDVPFVSVHRECVTGDAFAALRCHCRFQLQTAMERIATEGCGAVVYLRGQAGCGMELSSHGVAGRLDDERLGIREDYNAAAQILLDLGITAVRCLLGHPSRCAALEAAGVQVVHRELIEAVPWRSARGPAMQMECLRS